MGRVRRVRVLLIVGALAGCRGGCGEGAVARRDLPVSMLREVHFRPTKRLDSLTLRSRHREKVRVQVLPANVAPGVSTAASSAPVSQTPGDPP